jgi:hypothetical protein
LELFVHCIERLDATQCILNNSFSATVDLTRSSVPAADMAEGTGNVSHTSALQVYSKRSSLLRYYSISLIYCCLQNQLYLFLFVIVAPYGRAMDIQLAQASRISAGEPCSSFTISNIEGGHKFPEEKDRNSASSSDCSSRKTHVSQILQEKDVFLCSELERASHCLSTIEASLNSLSAFISAGSISFLILTNEFSLVHL